MRANLEEDDERGDNLIPGDRLQGRIQKKLPDLKL
jgi:hypothetical protein